MMLVTVHPGLGEAEGDGVDDRRPHAAPDADGVAGLDELGGPAQGPGDVLDRVADLERDEVLGALADGLDHQRDRAALRGPRRRSSAGSARRRVRGGR